GDAHGGPRARGAAAARREPPRRRRVGGRRRGGDRRVPGGEAGPVKLLVFLEHHDGAATKAALGVLAKARTLGDAAGLVAGRDVRSVAESVGGIVHVAE